MANLNKVMLIGRLGQDPEIKDTDSGKKVANVSIATNDFWNDASGNKQERTEWHRLVFWERLATLAESYLKKGSQIYVEGSLQTREWMKDDEKRYITEVKVFKLEFLSSNDPEQVQQSAQQPRPIDPPSYQDSERENLQEEIGHTHTSQETWHDRQDAGNDQTNIQRIREKFSEQEGVKDDIPF
tara:strand:+ start:1313 stop:1864 length:552 start_codon:yes stop_codon:yes gene_type:complete